MVIFFLQLIQDDQLSVTRKSRVNSVVRLIDCLDMTIAVYQGRKITIRTTADQGLHSLPINLNLLDA